MYPEDCKSLVVRLLRDELQYSASTEKLVTAHRLPNPPSAGNQDKIHSVVKFCNHLDKKDVISAAKSVKPANLYFTENLTPQRQTIAYVLSKARKEFPSVAAGSCTQNGENYVWLKPANGSSPSARNTKHKVSSYSVLSVFCSKTQKETSLTHVSEWKQ